MNPTVKLKSMLPAGLVVVALMASTTKAQVTPDPAAVAEPTNGFVVRKESKPTMDSLEDFERFRDKRAWEKAFTALDKVAATDPGRMVSAGSGFYVPTADRILTELLSLPADGRQAYRLFNDARAKQLLDQSASSTDEVTDLRKIVFRYFITSVGDQAADRLGDALFERGDFNAAERQWKLVIDSYPDTSLSIPLLQIKRVIALTRAKDLAAADAIACGLDPTVSVRLGGEDVRIGKVLESLKVAPSSGGSAGLIVSSAVNRLADFGLPKGPRPVWEIPLLDPDQFKAMKMQMVQNGQGAMITDLLQNIPSSAVDGKRIYVNFGGVCFAADLRTGKLLWQTDSLGDTMQKMRNGQMGSSGGAFTTTLTGDNVIFSRGGENSRGNQNNATTTLLCLNCSTGKPVWRSDRGALSAWSVVGSPLIDGGQILLVGHRAGASAEVGLLSIDVATGVIRWTTPLGEFMSVANEYRGTTSDPMPNLLKRADKLDILTNNGAVMEVDLNSHGVEWAFSCPTLPPPQPYYYYNPAATVPSASGSIVADDTTLYFKERSNDTLYALDPARHELKWKRPVDSTNGLVAIQGRHLLLTGLSAQCIDLETRQLLWDTPLSTMTADMHPVVCGKTIYTLGSKGIDAVDGSTGAIATTLPVGGPPPEGGDMWKTPDRLITVSASTITAYAVAPSGGK